MKLNKNSFENVICVSYFELLRAYDMLTRAFTVTSLYLGELQKYIKKISPLVDNLTIFTSNYALGTHSVFVGDFDIHKTVTGQNGLPFYNDLEIFAKEKKTMYEWRHRKSTVIHSFVPYFLKIGIHKSQETFITELANSIDCNHDVPFEMKKELARIWIGATFIQASMIVDILGKQTQIQPGSLTDRFYKYIKEIMPEYDREKEDIILRITDNANISNGLRAADDDNSDSTPGRLGFFISTRKIIAPPDGSQFYLYVYLSHGAGKVETGSKVPKGLEMYTKCAGKLFKLSTSNNENIKVDIPIDENNIKTFENEGSVCFVVFCTIPGRPGRFEWEGFGRIPYNRISDGKAATQIQSGPFNSTISFDESEGEFKLKANNLMMLVASGSEIDETKCELKNKPMDLCGNSKHKKDCYDYIIKRRNKLIDVYKETAKTVTFAYLYPIFPSQVLCSFAVTMMESPPYPVEKLCQLIDLAVAAHYSDSRTFVDICDNEGKISADEMEVIRAVVKMAFGFAGCLNYRPDKYVTGTPAAGAAGGIKISSDNAKNAWITGEGDCEDTAETVYHIIRYFCSLADLSAPASASASAIHRMMNRDYIPGMTTLYAHIGGQHTLHSMCLLMPSSSAHESKHPILLEGTSPRQIHVKTLREVVNFPTAACDKIVEVCGDSDENVSTWQYRPSVTRGTGCDGRYIGFIDFCAIVGNQPVDWYFEPDDGSVIPSFDSVMNREKGAVPFIERPKEFENVVKAHEYIRPFGHFPMPQFVESNNVPSEISGKCKQIDDKCAEFNNVKEKNRTRKEGFCSSATMYFNWREFSIEKYDPVDHLTKLLNQEVVKNELYSVKHTFVEMFPTIYVSIVTMIYRKK